jgi:hypothetical protein
MINQQLVDYIKQQLQAGVSRDVVLKALGDAGWPAADVSDSMKAATPATPGAVAAAPATPAATINPVVAMGGVDTMAGPGAATAKSSSEKFFARPATAAQVPVAIGDDEEDHPSIKKFVTTMVVMGIVILLLAGALVFVYFNLNSQLDSAMSGNPNISGEVTTLQGQVSQLAADKETLTTQANALTAERDELATELSFLVAAPSAGTSTPVTATVKGMLSGNASTTFALTTIHNVRVLVANSKDAAVSAALTPLVTGTSTVTLAGTHLPGSLNLTVTAVNGTAF